MPIGVNKVVTIHYTLKDEDGNLLDSTIGAQPFSFLSGHDQIIPKLEEEIDPMLIGTKKTIFLQAEEAYGLHNEQLFQVISKNDFPEDLEIKVGMQFVTNAPDGSQMPFTIAAIDDDNVTIDFNHPLAGKNLEFDIHLIDVRDATPEEIAHGHVHGPNSYH